MKTKLRFSIYFIVGIITWLLSLGLMIMMVIEVLFPILYITEAYKYYDLLVFIGIALNIIICSTIFGWYFGGPLWFIISWIANLSKGNYDPPAKKRKIYTKKNKLKRRYRLYEEVIVHLHTLSISLQKAEHDRIELERAKKDWIAGISHDVKTPLTYITGYSALLLNDQYNWKEEEKITFLQEIERKARHIESLVQDLHLSYQMDNNEMLIPLQLNKVNIIELVQTILADIANDPRARKYHFSFQSSLDRMQMEVDEKLIQRIFQNILMNAVIHNDEGTNIEVIIEKLNDAHIQFIVKDDGKGMESEVVDHLFNSNYVMFPKNRLDDNGLGMSIVQKLVTAHQGQISVTSEKYKGTTIIISLPIKKNKRKDDESKL